MATTSMSATASSLDRDVLRCDGGARGPTGGSGAWRPRQRVLLVGTKCPGPWRSFWWTGYWLNLAAPKAAFNAAQASFIACFPLSRTAACPEKPCIFPSYRGQLVGTPAAS